ERDRLRIVALAQARVRLAVGDVRGEAAFLEHDLLAADPGRAELAERLRRGGPLTSPLPGLREECERAGKVDGEELLLRLERAGLLSLLDVRPVAAVSRDDLLLVFGDADDARDLEQADRVVEPDRVERHRLE